MTWGPVTLGELEDLARLGRIHNKTVVWRSDSDQRMTYGDLRTPQGAAAPHPWGGVWQDGRHIIVRLGTDLPIRCVKCNEDDTVLYGPRRVTWHAPAYYLLAFIWPIYFRLSRTFTRQAEIAAGVCPRHNRLRLTVKWSCFVLALVLAGISFLGMALDWDPSMAFKFSVFALPALFCAVILMPVIRAQRFSKSHVWLSGAGRPFLNQFPRWPES